MYWAGFVFCTVICDYEINIIHVNIYVTLLLNKYCVGYRSVMYNTTTELTL